MIRNCSTFKANTKLPVASFDDLHRLYVLHTVELRHLSPLVENSSISANYILFKKFYFFQKRDYLKKDHDYYLKLYFLDFIVIIYIYHVILQQKLSVTFSIILTASIYKSIPLLPS